MATENALGVYINPISSWKYVEHIYYMTVQLSPLSLNLFCLVVSFSFHLYHPDYVNGLNIHCFIIAFRTGFSL